jgi:26S proteasome regulatory subunit N5
MVSTGMVYAKIDRPKDEVRFMKKRCEEEVLSDWASDIGKLLGLVEETTYLIHKERMVQSH